MGDVECSDTTGDNKDIDRRIHCVNKSRRTPMTYFCNRHELRVKMLGVSARPRRNLGRFVAPFLFRDILRSYRVNALDFTGRYRSILTYSSYELLLACS